MRVLDYPYNATQCYLKDRYGNARAEFSLKNGQNSLAINSLGSYYETKAGLKFFIQKGEGVLSFSDTTKKLDFSAIDDECLRVIDFMLFYGHAPSDARAKEKELAQDFIYTLEKNAQKQASYLIPNGYEQAQIALLSPPQKENLC